MEKLGFIGLGIMGKPMAGHLIRAGQPVYLHSRSGVPAELIEAGGFNGDSAEAVTRQADIIFLMLPDTRDVETVLFGAHSVAAGLSPGKLVVDMSSISPSATRDFAQRVNQLDCEYLDAPVSGGEVGAEQAALSIMVGGPQHGFARAKPLFDLMGRNITLVGDHGAGQTAKVANQIIVALTIEAVGEALLFASRSGVDPTRVREALLGGFASSKILEVHGQRMIERNFDPGFRIGLHQKDLRLALDNAREMGLSLPNTATTQELFNACNAQGGEAWDHSALVRALELLANYKLDQGN
jgi:2-hydroxy-3-oxopropionate reductase